MSTDQVCGTFSYGMLVQRQTVHRVNLQKYLPQYKLGCYEHMDVCVRFAGFITCSLCTNRNVRTEMLCTAVCCANMTVFTYLCCGTCTWYFVIICNTITQKDFYANIFLCNTAETPNRRKTISAEIDWQHNCSVTRRQFIVTEVAWSFIIGCWLHGYLTLYCCLCHRTALCSRNRICRYVDREATDFSVTN